MGLDVVELVMELEVEFDIRIADDEAAQVMTLGHLHSLIHAKTARPADYCPSSRAFYRLRRALSEEFGVGRQQVTTTAAMDDLLPRGGRQRHWQRLGQLLGGWEMPRLRRPRWARWAITLLGEELLASVVLGVIYVATVPARGPVWPLLALPVWAALLWLAVRFTRPFAIELPAGCGTVRGTVEALLRTNYGRLVTEGRPVTSARDVQRDEVWERMCNIISEQLGVDRELLTPDSRFAEDLGAE
jgi:acyl carrier protein